MGSAFHQLCPRYSGTLTPTAPTAIRLWETFTILISRDPCICDMEVVNKEGVFPLRWKSEKVWEGVGGGCWILIVRSGLSDHNM